MRVRLCPQGRKSGKGCYVYSGRKGKDKSVNKDAEAIVQNYRIPVKGRWVRSFYKSSKEGVKQGKGDYSCGSTAWWGRVVGRENE